MALGYDFTQRCLVDDSMNWWDGETTTPRNARTDLVARALALVAILAALAASVLSLLAL